MTADRQGRVVYRGGAHILYDPALIGQVDVELFDIRWLEQHGEIHAVSTGGRGHAWFVDFRGQHWVLRHYRRGGLVAKLSRRLYLGWQLGRSRAWREWQLLKRLYDQQLPVPRPVAALVRWPWGRACGLHQACILVERIDGARTLADRIQHQPLTVDLWHRVGACIGRFHQHNVYHADLNANNIMLDRNDRVYLIDFDRGAVKAHGGWKHDNVQRLQRSLLKLQRLNATFHYDETCWRHLLQGYEETSSSG